MSANAHVSGTVKCPDCQNSLGEATGYLTRHHWDDDNTTPEPPRCPTCEGRGYISARHAKRLNKQQQFIQWIGGQFADERPDKNGCFSDAFITYAALVALYLILEGYDRADASLMAFTCAMIDFGYIREDSDANRG